jgi:hypothetical protein
MPFKTGTWGKQAKARSQKRVEYFKQYHKNHLYHQERKPEQEHIEYLARYNIKIPKGQLCEDCNSKQAKIRHHPDYSKPFKIVFLCAGCHLRRHPRKQIKPA